MPTETARPAAHELIGVIPAGGRGTRMHPLPCSKEIYPIGFTEAGEEDAPVVRPKVASQYLLESMRLAGSTAAYVVLGDGKWDVASYLGDGDMLQMHLAYLTIRESPDTPHTVDRAYAFVAHKLVVFGFPDIVFEPRDAFARLVGRQAETGAEVVLGLFPAETPEKVDMVEVDAAGRVTDIVIKPVRTGLRYAWIIAVWTPAFTRFLHDYLEAPSDPARELFVGDVLQAAIDAGLHVNSVPFDEGYYRDIGTPDDLVSAVLEASSAHRLDQPPGTRIPRSGHVPAPGDRR
jgi:glucose-1-phosphate thymidylyltransferase